MNKQNALKTDLIQAAHSSKCACLRNVALTQHLAPELGF